MAETFKSGPLADAVDFLFNPSNDVRIPGGVQKVIALKSNLRYPDLVWLLRTYLPLNESCIFTSSIYGKYSNALSATPAVNTVDSSTLDLTIVDGNTTTTETFTQICGNPLLDVKYAPSTPTISLAVTATDAAGGGTGDILQWTAPRFCRSHRS